MEKNAQKIYETNKLRKRAFKGIDIFDLRKIWEISDVPIMVYEILDPLIGTKECIFITSKCFEKIKKNI